jgi:predicted esterase
MKVIFSHGKESGPQGAKIERLAAVAREYGYRVESLDYTGIFNPDVRVELLLDALNGEKERILLVGSSMGGYVSLIAAELVEVTGIFLLAPALFMSGYSKQQYLRNHPHIEIVHGWSDDVVPPENSIRFAKYADCSLHLISGDHRLNSSLDIVERLFRQFLAGVSC